MVILSLRLKNFIKKKDTSRIKRLNQRVKHYLLERLDSESPHLQRVDFFRMERLKETPIKTTTI